MMTVFAGLLSTSGTRRILGNGTGRATGVFIRPKVAARATEKATIPALANMFLLLCVQRFHGVDRRRREQGQGGGVGVMTSAASRGAPLSEKPAASDNEY